MWVEDVRLDKPTSIDYNFRGDKKNHSAKKLRKTKEQLAGPSNDKRNEEDLEQKEPLPNPKALCFRTIHQKRQLLNIDTNPSLDLFQNPILDPIKFLSSNNSFMQFTILACNLSWLDMVVTRVVFGSWYLNSKN